jgi:hypothetical protein
MLHTHTSIDRRRGWGFIHPVPTGAYAVGVGVGFLGDKATRALSRPHIASCAEAKNVRMHTAIFRSILQKSCLIKLADKFTYNFFAS